MAQGDSGDRPEYKVYRSGDRTGDKPRDRGRDDQPEGRPDYKVYRSRRGLLGRARVDEGWDRLRQRQRDKRDPFEEGRRTPGQRVWRAVKWVALAIGAWLLLSLVLFLISAQTQEGVSERTEKALTQRGDLLTGSTILVIGSDKRPANFKEGRPGGGRAAEDPARSDSLLLLRVGVGSVRRLSILRDSGAVIAGRESQGVQKINAAYNTGAGTTIKTVESFLGNDLKINHVIEVSFQDFPEFIDALGGVDVKVKRKICSPPFGGKRVRLDKGQHHLSGKAALRFARVRKNPCAPDEDDRARAERQQQVLSGIRDSLISPRTFATLPWVSWKAPRTVRSDLKGPGLMLLFTDLLTGGSGKTRVLKPSPCPGSFELSCGPNGTLMISDQDKKREVERLLGKEG